jgi:hypothetical protein
VKKERIGCFIIVLKAIFISSFLLMFQPKPQPHRIHTLILLKKELLFKFELIKSYIIKY